MFEPRDQRLGRAYDLKRGLSALFVVLGIGAIALAGIVGPMYLFAAAATYTEMALLPIIGIALATVAGIALLAAAAYLIYNNWGAITGWFVGLWAGLQAIVGNALNWFASLPARFGEFGRNMIAGMINGITGMLGQLKATIVGAASSAANWFKSKLGIHSPSRVFAGFGGFMMQGLSNGIDGGAGEPVRRLDNLSRRMTAAIAVGTAVPAMATGVPAGAGSNAVRAAMPAGSSAPVTINIYGAVGQAPEDLAKAVRAEWDRLQREQAANGRATFADKPDWE